ncbi:cytochrome c oxidase subunit 4 isoform 1, mitochondrial-like [Phymastichus coffea]|uniref:cytochrome c oxidase subunit 4 isoform 1, mitochondrial-like n=1 Tax=Phymastichus coffea TaxID=108790 RepID=UPI00273C902E|nr:cytochrome c oxidase subunit 4 isoform 1, mitochondrial-like [Phymastichus coffea]
MLARCARGLLGRRRYSVDHGPRCDTRGLIGEREIVGYGHNGQPNYVDLVAFPFPAIRYRECTPQIMALREKERGDWRKLSVDEKKCLYRASFRQTLAELDAPTTQWKSILGTILMTLSLTFWSLFWIQRHVYRDLPMSFEPEARIAQYYRQVAINNQPFSGLYRPPGAELRIHPKNKQMYDEMMKSQ